MQKGNVQKALDELKKDKNNSVATILDNYSNKYQGLLSGATFTIKDIFATDFAKTQASSFILKDFEPHYNADCVQKLIEAGAVPVAKVHSDELALGGTGTFSAFGLITNPLDSKRYSGGSSSGSVATFTKNISFALASDTGDSVRLPASFIGCVGFKPSYGAISRYGMFPYASSLDTVSYFAHNTQDIVELSQVLYGRSVKDMNSKNIPIKNVKSIKPKKVAILNTEGYSQSYVWKSIEKVLKILQKDDIQCDLIKPDINMVNAIKPLYDIISYAEASANLANLNGIAFGNRVEQVEWQDTFKQTRKSGFGKMVQRRLTLGSFFLKEENQEDLFLRAQKIRRLYKDHMNKYYREYDVVLYAASNGVAPLFTDNSESNFTHWILTGANLIGNPSISIPLNSHEGLPYNLCIDSYLYNDEKLLSYSLYIEKLIDYKGGQ